MGLANHEPLALLEGLIALAIDLRKSCINHHLLTSGDGETSVRDRFGLLSSYSMRPYERLVYLDSTFSSFSSVDEIR